MLRSSQQATLEREKVIMDAKCKAEFISLVSSRLLKHGQIYSGSYYGWSDFDCYMHLEDTECSLSYDGEPTIQEISHRGFAGTFADSDEAIMLVTASPVSCACGFIKGRTIGVEGSYGKLVTDLLFSED